MTDEKNFLEQTYTSPTGKEVEIVKIENTALYAIQYCKGGTSPEEFEGMFTSPKHCKEAMDAYFSRVQRALNEKEKKQEELQEQQKVKKTA